MSRIRSIAVERPVGTPVNQQIAQYLSAEMRNMGYTVRSLPLECLVWERGMSWIRTGEHKYDVLPGPMSLPCRGTFPAVTAGTFGQLRDMDITGKLLCLHGELGSEPLMPKDFPFYYPDEHRRIIDLLERKKPAAVLACTGKHPMSGMSPYPLFEDGEFMIPSAYTDESILDTLGSEAEVFIESNRIPAESSQIIARKPGTSGEKILICAHMDTKYNSPGALDNAAGVSVLLEIMEILSHENSTLNMEFVPFNGEEYYGLPGQLAYLDELTASGENIKLAVNIDGPGHVGSASAVSWYNMTTDSEKSLEECISSSISLSPGRQWYEGDHSMFAFQGIPCIAVTSSDMSALTKITHTPDDTPDKVDEKLLHNTARDICSMLTGLKGL